MNKKLFYLIATMLLCIIGVLVARILVLREIPEGEPFNIHIATLNAEATWLKNESLRYKRKVYSGNNPKVIRALSTLDNLLFYFDSAELHLKHLVLASHDSRPAKTRFETYAAFSRRHTSFLQKTFPGDRLWSENYLLAVDQKLPGGALPLDSEEGVRLITAMLRFEFYRRTNYYTERILGASTGY